MWAGWYVHLSWLRFDLQQLQQRADACITFLTSLHVSSPNRSTLTFQCAVSKPSKADTAEEMVVFDPIIFRACTSPGMGRLSFLLACPGWGPGIRSLCSFKTDSEHSVDRKLVPPCLWFWPGVKQVYLCWEEDCGKNKMLVLNACVLCTS